MKEWSPSVRRLDGNEKDLLQAAQALLRQGSLNAARDEYQKVLTGNPKSAGAHLGLGRICLTEKIFDEALAYALKAITLDALFAPAHLLAGIAYTKIDDTEKAINSLQTALNIDPDSRPAQLLLSRCLLKTDKYSEAKDLLKNTIRRDPQQAAARIMLARAYSGLGREEDAMRELRSAEKIGPDNANIKLQIARALLRGKKYDDALTSCQEAIEINADNPAALFLLGRINEAQGDSQQAQKAYQQVIALKPKKIILRILAQVRLVESLIKTEQFDEAERLLKRLPANSKIASLVHRLFGDIYRKKSMFKEAVEEYRAALLHSPDNETVISKLEDDLLTAEETDFEKISEMLRSSIISQWKTPRARRNGQRGMRR